MQGLCIAETTWTFTMTSSENSQWMAPLGKSASKDRSTLIGYARVSTIDQNLDLQLEALTKAGLQENLRGQDQRQSDRTPRIRQDAGIFTRRRHPGGELHKQGVQFKSLTDAIDTGTASGR